MFVKILFAYQFCNKSSFLVFALLNGIRTIKEMWVKFCLRFVCGLVKHVVLGKFLQYIFKPSATSIFMRSTWIVLILVFLPAVVLFSLKHETCVIIEFYKYVSLDRYIQFCLLFFGSLWAVYSGLRAEFVSKYTSLLNDLNNNISVNSLSNGTIEGKRVIKVDSAAMFFLEDCIVLGFEEHITFKQTCRWISSAIIMNSYTCEEYYNRELENLPVFRKKLKKMSKKSKEIEIKFWLECEYLDSMNEKFVKNT